MQLDHGMCVDPLVPRSHGAMRLTGLNHISRLSSDLAASRTFFMEVLGFRPIRRPSFDFDGSWLIGFGVGLHLLYSENANNKEPLNPRADHLSFTCDSLALVEQRLQERRIPFVKQTVLEHGVKVSQVFFKDPGGSGMIEVCNCDCLPIILLEDENPQVEWMHKDMWQQDLQRCGGNRGSLDSSCSSEDGFEI